MIVLPSIAITSPTELLELLMPFLAVGCLILSLRLLSSLRAFQAFGMLIRMVLSTAGVMMHFIKLMLVMLVGLTLAWTVLAISFPKEHYLQEEDTVTCEPENDTSGSQCNCVSQAQYFTNHGWRMLGCIALPCSVISPVTRLCSQTSAAWMISPNPP